MRFLLTFLLALCTCATLVRAQSDPLVFSTVERPPFSFTENGQIAGFSIDLMQALAREIGRDVVFETKPSFDSMLTSVVQGDVDGAIANISITGAREAVLDFSQPIYRSGLQIMLPLDSERPSMLTAILNRDLGIAIIVAFTVLLGMGMLMWVFERKRQPYFDRNFSTMMFPAFWWALNLVVNGGFEQNEPRSPVGRVFAVLMVISSLFVVSFFVANITASMTVQALNGTVQSINDLEGKNVGTTVGSTASAFLTDRDIAHVRFEGFVPLIDAFESGALDAVFFDTPLLSYYVQGRGADIAELMPRVFRPENYGIALPSGSPLREDIDVALLRLVETGEYNTIADTWFRSIR